MNARVGAVVTPLGGWITRDVSPTLAIAAAAVAFVLLLACANVAHLVLVRTIGRTNEFAVSLALGASPSRLARLMLVENLLIALAGGVAGTLLAVAALPLLLRLAPEIPRLSNISVSGAALVFGPLMVLVVLALVAVPSLIQALRADLHGSSKRRRFGFGRWVVETELALGLAVIATAALLGRSFSILVDEDPGFRSQGVLAVEMVGIPAKLAGVGKIISPANCTSIARPSGRCVRGGG
jgi:hypothetical protein